MIIVRLDSIAAVNSEFRSTITLGYDFLLVLYSDSETSRSESIEILACSGGAFSFGVVVPFDLGYLKIP